MYEASKRDSIDMDWFEAYRQRQEASSSSVSGSSDEEEGEESVEGSSSTYEDEGYDIIEEYAEEEEMVVEGIGIDFCQTMLAQYESYKEGSRALPSTTENEEPDAPPILKRTLEVASHKDDHICEERVTKRVKESPCVGPTLKRPLEVASHKDELTWEERAAKRAKESREFCETMVPNLTLSDYEKAHLHCPSDRHPHRSYTHPVNHSSPCNEPTPEPLCKKVFTISSKRKGGRPSILNYMIENYVHTTYFYNGLTGATCAFNIVSLAKCLIKYYVEYSCKKFAKVNLRLLHGLSHLIYTSSVLVETGSDNQATSLRLLADTVRLLREECGYPHLCIRARVCQNIVLTGHVNCPIDLDRLSALFHKAIYDKEDFAGVIIKLTDLEDWFANRSEATEFPLSEAYMGEDDDTAFIAEINSAVVENRPVGGAEAEKELEQALRMTDEFERHRPKKRQKGTFLVFAEGQLIFTGCKSEKKAHGGFILMYKLLESCRQQH